MKSRISNAYLHISLLSFSKAHGKGKPMAYHVNKSDVGHTCLKQYEKKNALTTFTDTFKNSDEKKKMKKKKTAAQEMVFVLHSKFFALHSNKSTCFNMLSLNTLPEISSTLQQIKFRRSQLRCSVIEF